MNGKQHPLCTLLETAEYDVPSAPSEPLESKPMEPEQEVWQFEPGICG